jgi:hypothetical protein
MDKCTTSLSICSPLTIVATEFLIHIIKKNKFSKTIQDQPKANKNSTLFFSLFIYASLAYFLAQITLLT